MPSDLDARTSVNAEFFYKFSVEIVDILFVLCLLNQSGNQYALQSGFSILFSINVNSILCLIDESEWGVSREFNYNL